MRRLMFVAVMGSAMPCWASGETFQDTQGTIVAEVNNSVEATEDGCVIEYAEGPQEVDCETLEPAGGSDEDE